MEGRYEALKKLATKDGQRSLDTPTRLACGAGAGIASVVTTYPLDLLRSRISLITAAVGHATSAELAANAQLGLKGMTIRVVQEGGVKALYKGVTLTALGVAPYVGINFALYELFRGLVLPKEGDPSVLRKLACVSANPTIMWCLMLIFGFRVLWRRFDLAGVERR